MAKPPRSLLLPNRKSHTSSLRAALISSLLLSKYLTFFTDNWHLFLSARRQAADLTVFCLFFSVCVTDHWAFVLKSRLASFPAVPDSLMSISWIRIQSLYEHSSCSVLLFKERLEVCRFTLAQRNEAAGMPSEESCTGAVYQKEKCIKYTFHTRRHQPLHPQLQQEDERLGGSLIYSSGSELGELSHLNYCACCLVAGGGCSPASLFRRVGSAVHMPDDSVVHFIKGCARPHMMLSNAWIPPKKRRCIFFIAPPPLVACLQHLVHIELKQQGLTTWCFSLLIGHCREGITDIFLYEKPGQRNRPLLLLSSCLTRRM